MSPIKAFKVQPKAPMKSVTAKVTAATTQRKSRRKYFFPLETLQAYSHYRQDEAAKLLNVASITLKRICRLHRYRWPYRSIKAQMRRDAIAAQKLKAAKVPTTPKVSKSSAESTSEILLQLQKVPVTASPTSVSGLSSPISQETTVIRSPTTQFPMLEPLKPQLPQLPPLTLMLQWQNRQSSAARLRPTLDYKKSMYAASFDTSAPKFPTGRLASLLNTCETERRRFPTAEMQSTRYQHPLYHYCS